MEREFVVVPIINDKSWKWGVRAPRRPYESHPSMIGKFRRKEHAEQFAAGCNDAVAAMALAPNIYPPREPFTRGPVIEDAVEFEAHMRRTTA